MFRLLRQFCNHVVPHIIRPMRVVWNQVIGFLFLSLAVWAAVSLTRHVREFKGDAESIFKLVLSGLFIMIMAGFGIFSFLRAHRISKS